MLACQIDIGWISGQILDLKKILILNSNIVLTLASDICMISICSQFLILSAVLKNWNTAKHWACSLKFVCHLGGRNWDTSKSVGRNFRFLDSLEDTRLSRKGGLTGNSDPNDLTHLPKEGSKCWPWKSIFLSRKTQKRQDYPHILYHNMVLESKVN